MQRESVRRGFGISHQKVVLQTDIASRTAHGYTELTIVPLSRELRTIHLHARCDIHAVTVAVAPGADTIRADFIHHDATQAVAVSDATDVHLHPELKRRLFAAAAEADEGELSIAIPTTFALHPVSPLSVCACTLLTVCSPRRQSMCRVSATAHSATCG